MSKAEKIMDKVMSGNQDESILFSDLCHLPTKMGYSMRIKGSHHSFTKAGAVEFINIQPNGSKAKGYQVRQNREIFKGK